MLPKVGSGTWSTMVPVDVLPGPPAPIWAWLLATKPPSAVAMAVSVVSTDSTLPSGMVRSTEPVASILADWLAPCRRVDPDDGADVLPLLEVLALLGLAAERLAVDF